jgi:uncharacterized protein YkwD
MEASLKTQRKPQKRRSAKRMAFAGFVLFGCGLLVHCGPLTETTRIPVSSSAPAPGRSLAQTQDVTSRLERAINDYRASIGRKPIPRVRGLDDLARQHCEFMARNRGRFTLGAKNVSHYGFEERALVARRRFGMEHCAENVIGGFVGGDIASELVKVWSESEKHQFNLRQSWDATGVGIYVAEDGFVYATQFFGNRGMSGLGFTDRFGSF